MTEYRTSIIDRRSVSWKEPECWKWHFTVEVYDGVQAEPRFIASAAGEVEARRLADDYIRRQR